ncbi:MAG: metallophosphoesterase [Clostridia bacterium]
MVKLKKKYILAIFIAVIAIVSGIMIYVGNSAVGITQYEISDKKIPESFSNFRIAQISDLHNTDNNEKIIGKLKSVKPDIIVITGDMIDARNTKVSVALDFTERAVKIAPVYYVTGNHEARRITQYNFLKEGLIDLGVSVMENTVTEIEKNGEKITLIGLHDTGFDFNTGIDYSLKSVLPDNESYKILLAHRPEYFEKYKGVDLVFSGHAHGGQVRLPFIGGLFAPGQGIFPKYDGGVYQDGDLTMVVSRGLGNSLFPFRVNNNPEIVVVTLKRG